jgi:hypothetical protein
MFRTSGITTDFKDGETSEFILSALFKIKDGNPALVIQ